MSDGPVAGSFRDPAGHLYQEAGQFFRKIEPEFAEEFRNAAPIHRKLIEAELLVSHETVRDDSDGIVVRPEEVPFISYPYEWCFGQLKDAALVTLEVQTKCLRDGFTLKDASTYNVQFMGGRPIFIDTLSIVRHKEGEPWIAYRQFCQHFLAPLALMSCAHSSLGRLSLEHLDGVPLEVASRLLPWKTRLRPWVNFHIHLQARMATMVKEGGKAPRVSVPHLIALVESLSAIVASLSPKKSGSHWDRYYRETNYSQQAEAEKKRSVAEMVALVRPKSVWDLGANVGVYSRIAAESGARVISLDSDPIVVDRNYALTKSNNDRLILPLVQDLSNPSPSLGWGHQERRSLEERGPADALLALALVHHLTIANNVPLHMVADWFSKIARCAIVEFVPEDDSQVRRLVANRQGVHHPYSRDAFVQAFSRNFQIADSRALADSRREIFLLRRSET